jgi:hypothetical protein
LTEANRSEPSIRVPHRGIAVDSASVAHAHRLGAPTMWRDPQYQWLTSPLAADSQTGRTPMFPESRRRLRRLGGRQTDLPRLVSDSSYFTGLGMEVELQRLEERAAQIRAWLRKLPERQRRGSRVASADGASSAAPSTRRRRKRKMSAEARRRISEAQKARCRSWYRTCVWLA